MIFGKGNPIIKATDDSFEFEMLYTGIIPTFRDTTILENISPINGEVDHVYLWNHINFDLIVRLFNHDDPTGYYNQLFQIINKEIYLKPHKFRKDGLSPSMWLKDPAGANLVFYCSKFKPYYLDNINKFDIIDINLQALKPAEIEAYSTGMLKE